MPRSQCGLIVHIKQAAALTCAHPYIRHLQSPITPMGKLIGFFWMTVGLVVFGVINGSVSAALLSYKASTIRHVAVNSMDQLVSGYRPICTTEGAHRVFLSTSGQEQDVDFTVAATTAACDTLMNSGKASSLPCPTTDCQHHSSTTGWPPSSLSIEHVKLSI